MLVGLLVVAAVLAGVVLYLERGGTDLRLADDGATVTLAPGQEAVVSLPGGAWQFDTGSGRDVVELVDGPVRTCGRYATSDCTNLFRVRARQPGSVDIHLSCLFLCPSRPGTATPTAQWRVHVTVPDPTKLR